MFRGSRASPRPPGDAFASNESKGAGRVRKPGVGAAARAGARSRARDGARAHTVLIAHRDSDFCPPEINFFRESCGCINFHYVYSCTKVHLYSCYIEYVYNAVYNVYTYVYTYT